MFHLLADGGGSSAFSYGRTVTLSGTPAFATRFAQFTYGGIYICGGMTFTGAATGTRYYAAGHSLIETGGGGASYLPGNAAGFVDATTHGVYN